MASAKFEGPEGGATLAEPDRKKGKFEGPMAVSDAAATPTISQLGAAGRGLLHGATLGLEGYLAAAGMAEAQGLTGEDLGGGNPAEVLKEQRRIAAERILEARQQYPKTTGVSEFIGGMATPIPVPRGTGLLGRMGIGAGTGTGIGAVSSFGGAENPTVPQFLAQTGAGAVAGGALPAVTAPLGYAARAVGQKLGIDRFPMFRNAEHEVASAVNRAEQENAVVEQQARQRYIDEARQASQLGLPPPPPYERQSLSRAEVGRGPALPIDVLGTSGEDLARSAANLSSVARATMRGPLYQRRAGQAERAAELVSPDLRYQQAGQQVEALRRPSPETNRAYQVAREIGDGRIDMAQPELQALSQTRVVQAAYRHVQSDLEDKHKIDTVLRQQQGLPPRQAPSLNDLATWDLVKRRLDDTASAAFEKKSNTRGGVAADAARMLRGALDQQVPEYADARARAQAEILARNAFQEGGAFLTKGDTYETQQALARLATQAPQAVETFRQGFMHAMLTKAGKKPTEGNLLAQIKATPDATQRMTIALGQPMVQRLERQRADEGIMQRSLEAVVGNSTTARQLTNVGLAAGGGALTGAASGLTADDLFGLGGMVHSGIFGGNAGAAVAGLTAFFANKRGGAFDKVVANGIAQMLVSRDPGQLARLEQIAATSPPLQQALTLLRDNVLNPALTRGAAGAAAGAAAP